MEKCPVCNKGFRMLVPHYLVEHLKQKIECHVCSLQFKSFKSLSLHHRHEHPNEPFKARSKKCSICFKEFNDLGNLNNHIKSVHINLKSQSKKVNSLRKCPLCKKEHQSLVSHYLVEHLKQKIECSECDRQFETFKCLSMHNRRQHPNMKISLDRRCSICLKEFANFSRLHTHILGVHLNARKT